jgi:hypothetical protein
LAPGGTKSRGVPNHRDTGTLVIGGYKGRGALCS